MVKELQKIVALLAISLVFVVTVFGQTNRKASFSGVYAGVQVIYGYNNTSLYTHCYYFRPDGTFVKELEQPDWQTRIDGTFTVKGKVITLVENGEKPETMEITDDKTIQANGYVMGRFKVMNRVPANGYSRTSASGSGGIGTGTTYVGTASNSDFVFDGNGRFSNSSATSVAVIGSNVGGGSGNNKSGRGGYSIKDSLLTLNYDDGRVETKSLFYSEASSDSDVSVALINGSYFYAEKKSPIAEKEIVKESKVQNKPISSKERPVGQAKFGGPYAGVLLTPV